ncbi:MAG: hypothetical protein AVDCRST_MAG52-563 [uncultured Blastococcus sp.]|uniref:Uncharacterized protein n=1 Tax=uncultured Blastococcus sp. TaxID=217144 RepID=A0A6J4HGL4_9ACTN|nr:MAG: hypothetical protein AVDCRST_MAG52-563 [uncultured Blastococcus sp.]
MSEGLRLALVVVLVAAGVAMICWAGYLQYASLPHEHTVRQGAKRTALAGCGMALILGGSRLS